MLNALHARNTLAKAVQKICIWFSIINNACVKLDIFRIHKTYAKVYLNIKKKIS